MNTIQGSGDSDYLPHSWTELYLLPLLIPGMGHVCPRLTAVRRDVAASTGSAS